MCFLWSKSFCTHGIHLMPALHVVSPSVMVYIFLDISQVFFPNKRFEGRGGQWDKLINSKDIGNISCTLTFWQERSAANMAKEWFKQKMGRAPGVKLLSEKLGVCGTVQRGDDFMNAAAWIFMYFYKCYINIIDDWCSLSNYLARLLRLMDWDPEDLPRLSSVSIYDILRTRIMK